MSNRKLVVEVCHATNLMPKDGDGTSSPFVTVEFDGQLHKSKVKDKDLSPVWNEKFEFNVSSEEMMDEECINVSVFTMLKNRQRRSLGKVKIPGYQVKKQGTEEAETIAPYSLEKRGLFTSVFARGKGQLYLKLYYYEETLPDAKAKEGEKEEKKEKEAAGGDDEADVKKPESSASSIEAAEDVGSFEVKKTNPKLNSERVVHDLVLPIQYLFVNVVKARDLAAKDVTGSSDPYVQVTVAGSNRKAQTEVRKQTLNPEWNSVFAFDLMASAAETLEITVWDKDTVTNDDFLGCLAFDVAEIPPRRPPDSPLAPQWYKLAAKTDEKRAKGEIMLAVWLGTQADEAFPDAWQSDTGGIALNRSKVYISPRLWYLRVRLIEAQDLVQPGNDTKFPAVVAVAELGGQIHSRPAGRRGGITYFQEEEILFVAAEPFVEQQLIIKVLGKVAKNKDELIGSLRIPLYKILQRMDRKPVEPKWFDLEKEKNPESAPAADATKNGGPPPPPKAAVRPSSIQITASLDGGYHVLDETTHHTSDVQPAERALSKLKPAIGVLELGILGGHSLVPTKTRQGKGTADTYCIAKYGKKWTRTRTVVGSLSPQWHEQYTWEVFDPCTVLTVGVFDNHHLNDDKAEGAKDAIIGKLHIRLSTLRTDRTYTHSYPLISLERSGVKKKGNLEIAVRFSCISQFNLIRAYGHPLLPKLHYLEPLSVRQVQALRKVATNIQIAHLNRAEPPIRPEVVRYMLDTDAHVWSYRRSKATWKRFSNVFSGARSFSKWLHDICHWKSKVATVLVILLYFILVCFPKQILPTLFLYICFIGAWHSQYPHPHPPHMDIHLSQAALTFEDVLDEEFDTHPSSKSPEIIKARYDRLRSLAGHVQVVLTDLVTQLERFHALLSWRDPRATFIFIMFCFIVAIILYVTPLHVIGVLLGFYFFRPPRFRDCMPCVPMNFFRRLPTLSDSIL